MRRIEKDLLEKASYYMDFEGDGEIRHAEVETAM
jgi:hypothetical protein